GFILAGFGFVANAVQTESAITGIRLMFNLLPAAFFLLGGLLMVFYKIDRKTLATVEADLLKRRISSDPTPA
ncbi:MAG: MFS transporter, partial [Pseudomonadota bacterium]